MKMFVKGDLSEKFSENCVRRWSNNYTSDEPMNSEGSPTHSLRRVVQYFYRNSVVCFQEQKTFVLKTDYFTHMLA